MLTQGMDGLATWLRYGPMMREHCTTHATSDHSLTHYYAFEVKKKVKKRPKISLNMGLFEPQTHSTSTPHSPWTLLSLLCLYNDMQAHYKGGGGTLVLTQSMLRRPAASMQTCLTCQITRPLLCLCWTLSSPPVWLPVRLSRG